MKDYYTPQKMAMLVPDTSYKGRLQTGPAQVRVLVEMVQNVFRRLVRGWRVSRLGSLEP
jgi:hypothetical protein